MSKWRCGKCGRYGQPSQTLGAGELCARCVNAGWRINPRTGSCYRVKVSGKLTVTWFKGADV